MKFRNCVLGVLALSALILGGCGNSGGAGLNGGLTVTAAATGSVVNATATYTNSQATDLTGTPITFTALVGNQSFSLGTFNTNTSGSATVAFTPPAFNSSQTITVIATTDKLTNFSSIVMTGRSLTVTPPAAVTLTTAQAGGTSVPFIIQPAAGFVTITDPFSNDLSGHAISISASFVSNNSSDSLSPPTSTATNSVGTAIFPGANGTLIVPAASGGVETMTITWTVTDQTTGLSGTGITTVTLTKTS